MADNNKAIYAGLLQVQQGLRVAKEKDGGKFKYRSAEDIIENVKPLLKEAGLAMFMNEEILTDNLGSFIQSSVTVVDIATGASVTTKSMAREDTATKFMSPGQATGAAISYARKYALGGMFAVDNNDDLDSPEYNSKQENAQKAPQQAQSKKTTTNKGNAQKTPQQANDAVRAQCINKAIAEIQRLKLPDDIVAEIAHRHYKANGWGNMTDKQIVEFTENLEKWAAEL